MTAATRSASCVRSRIRGTVRGLRSPGIICRGFLFLILMVADLSNAQTTTSDQAEAWYAAGLHDKARQAYEVMLASDPEQPEALYYLGLLSEGKASEQYFLKLLNHSPDHALAEDALLGVVRVYHRAGQHEEAIRACNRFLMLHQESVHGEEIRYWQGMSLLADKRTELARLSFRQLLGLYPDSRFNVQARMGIAETFRAEKSYVEAAKVYLEMENDPAASDSASKVLYHAGQCLAAAERDVEARHVFRRLLQRFPESAEAGTVADRQELSSP